MAKVTLCITPMAGKKYEYTYERPIKNTQTSLDGLSRRDNTSTTYSCSPSKGVRGGALAVGPSPHCQLGRDRHRKKLGKLEFSRAYNKKSYLDSLMNIFP